MTALGRSLFLGLPLMLLSCGHRVGAQTLEPVDALVMVDANGAKVGMVYPPADGGGVLFFKFGGGIFRFRADATLTGLGRLLFESPDCTGPGYVFPVFGPYSLFPADAVTAPPGRTLYIPNPNATSAVVVFHSWWQDNSILPSGGNCEGVSAGSSTLASAIAATDIFIPLTSAGQISGSGTVKIDAELITYSSVSNSPPGLTVSVRGADGTQAAEHSAGAEVYVASTLVPMIPSGIDLDTAFTRPFKLVPVTLTGSTATCCGDCSGDGKVSVDELVTSVNNALSGCPASR